LGEEERKAQGDLLIHCVCTQDVEGVICALKTGLEPRHIYPVNLTATLVSTFSRSGSENPLLAYFEILRFSGEVGNTATTSTTSPLHLATASGKLSLISAIALQSAWSGEGGVVDSLGWTPLEALLYSRFFQASRSDWGSEIKKYKGKDVSQLGDAEADNRGDCPPPPPLLKALTPSLLELLVSVLLTGHPRDYRKHALAVYEACVESALRGDCEDAMATLDREKRVRGGIDAAGFSNKL